MVKQQNNRKKNENIIVKFIKEYINYNYGKSLVLDPSKLPIVSIGILIVELILNIFVVQNVKYTEIDWIAYMQECEGFINGTTNYSLLKGDTGPLVYPAGFLYIYSILYFITARGQNIRLAQYIFIGIYLIQMFLVLKLYSKSRKVPPYVLVVSAFTSYRIHSIYVLRLFNDPVAILFLYASINFYCNGKWTMGSIFLSIAISIKMNILLFAPAILLIYIINLGYLNTIKQLIICGIIQLILALPFIIGYPMEYIKGSFDFGRIFEHKWTVNYRFLNIELFENKLFHFILLGIHLTLLGIFLMPCFKYVQSYCRLRNLQLQLQPQIDLKNTEEKQKVTKKEKQKFKQSDKKLTNEQEQLLNKYEQSLAATPNNNTNYDTNIDSVKKKQSSEMYEIYFDKSIQLILLPIFLVNFIGIVCARSLHYQFYVWYFHSLPYLIWFTEYRLSIKFLLLGLIEYSWNTYPSTNLSSLLLHLSHIILLFGIGKKLFENKAEKIKSN